MRLLEIGVENSWRTRTAVDDIRSDYNLNVVILPVSRSSAFHFLHPPLVGQKLARQLPWPAASDWQPPGTIRSPAKLDCRSGGTPGRAESTSCWAPGVNIYKSPRNGRNFEYFGEDPWLASRMAVAYIEGMQSQNVSATVKHFMGNNSEFDRHNVDSIIDERTMRELYMPSFEAAVKEAHVGAVMDSYNLTNGSHMTQNGYLNTEVVKKEWGFDGIVMSDWLSTYDGVAAANGGLDLEMPLGAFMNRKTLLPAVQSGKLSEAIIDDKVRRIFRTASRFAWLDHN
jgi:beta-glucosidase-like glycosyl hydrolase